MNQVFFKTTQSDIEHSSTQSVSQAKPENTLTLDSVSYAYADGHKANTDISLELNHGIIGLLGPNGAGKTTLMKMLATINQASSGTISWNGQNISKNPNVLRDVLGYLPQDFGVFPALTAREFLRYLAVIKGVDFEQINERVDSCLAKVGLEEKAKEPMGSFSGGMRQRVGIAQALLNDPKLIIVDEPTVGLDPEERLRFRHLLTDLAASRVIILSTHIVSDIEASAMRLCVLNKGHLTFDDTPEKMIESACGKVWEMLISADDMSNIRTEYTISTSTRRAEGIMVRVVSDSCPTEQAVQVIPSLEDAYVWFLSQQEG